MDAPGKEVNSVVTLLVERMEAQSKSYAQSMAVVIESNQRLYTALDNQTCKFNSLADKFEGMVQQHAEDQSLISQLWYQDKEFRQQLGANSAHLLLSPQRGTSRHHRGHHKRKRIKSKSSSYGVGDDSGLDDDAMDDCSETSEPSVVPIGALAPFQLNLPVTAQLDVPAVAAQLNLPVTTVASVGRSAICYCYCSLPYSTIQT